MSGRAPERWRSTAPEDVLGSGMRILREVVQLREHGSEVPYDTSLVDAHRTQNVAPGRAHDDG
jgi:hypothetical protein